MKRKQKIPFFFSIILTAFLFSTLTTFADQEMGAPSIVLQGGNLGSIIFPHGRHQGIAVDCLPCHQQFPKEKNVINTMKEEGKLQKKEIMNLCKNCHADLAAKGEKAGPTNCKDCHKK